MLLHLFCFILLLLWHHCHVYAQDDVEGDEGSADSNADVPDGPPSFPDNSESSVDSADDSSCPLYNSLESGPPPVGGTVTCGGSIQGQITLGGEAWFTLQLSEGNAVTLSLCGASWDTVLTVYDTKLNCVKSNDDACGLASRISGLFLPSGDHFVKVNGLEGGAGDFLLSVVCGKSASGTCGEAQTISCGDRIGVKMPELLEPQTGSPTAWYTLTLVDQSDLTITARAEDGGVAAAVKVLAVTSSNACTNPVQVKATDDKQVNRYLKLEPGKYFITLNDRGFQPEAPSRLYKLDVRCAPKEPDLSCVDVPGWKDINGYTCEHYYRLGWCENWWYGSSWDKTWGTFANYATPFSIPADQACCKCGLSRKIKVPVSCSQSEWLQWSTCLSVGENVCQRSSTRPVKTMPFGGGQTCGDVIKTESCSSCSECSLTKWSDWACHSPGVSRSTRQVTKNEDLAVCGQVGRLEASEGSTCPATNPFPIGSAMQLAGDNSGGQRGTLDASSQFGLKAMDITYNNIDLPVTAVALGYYHTAVVAGRLLFMTGNNDHGQLGLGDIVLRREFQMVPLPADEEIVQLALGQSHSLVLTQKEASIVLHAFGDNTYGQLGADPSKDRNSAWYSPGKVNTSRYMAEPDGELFKADFRIASIAAGAYHSAFLSNDKMAYMFGSNRNGILGFTPITGYVPFIPVKLRINQKHVPMQQISLGRGTSLFLTISGSLYFSGYNYFNTVWSSLFFSPEFVMDGVHQIAAGGLHCLILLNSGKLIASGINDYGQLGVGTTRVMDPLQNVTFPTGVQIAKVAAGLETSAALSVTGELYTWGNNRYGQAGLIPLFNTSIPSIADTTDYAGPVEHVAMGANHIAVLRGKTGTATITRTMTRSLSSTITFTALSTISATSSVTQSATTSMTDSIPATPTPSFASCGKTNHSLMDEPWTLAAQTRCMQLLLLGPGTTTATERRVVLHILSLPAPLKISIVEGCRGTSEDCELTLSSKNSGDTIIFHLGAAEQAVMRLLYGSAETTEFRALLDPAQVEVSTKYKAGVVVLVPSCIACAVTAGLLVWLGRFLLNQWIWKHRANTWLFNERLARLSLQITMGVGLWSMLTGMGWCIVVAATSSPVLEPLGLLIAGGILAGLGFLLALGCWLWTQRDPEQHMCVACGQQVSRWRFIGTYVPKPDNPLGCGKGHTSHLACVLCGKLVIGDGWTEAPPHRPYHMMCWDAHCSAMVRDAQFVTRWMHTHRPNEVSETELVHLLAAAVKHSAEGSVRDILSINPALVAYPVTQDGRRSVMHLAAQAGNLSMLKLLLDAGPQCLDPVCATNPEAPLSFSISGLDEGNDIYVYQPLLTFNQMPVYLGHTYGKYLFFYDPPEDAGKDRLAPGWCLSSHLGSATTLWRVPFMDVMGVNQYPPACVPKGLPHRQTRSAPHRITQYFSKAGDVAVAGETSDLDGLDSGTVCPTASPASGGRHGQDETGDGVVVAAAPPALEMETLPHAISLMEEAVISGDIETIKYVEQLYKSQDAHCLLWKYYSCHGLWDMFPASDQAEIRSAMAEGYSTVTLTCESFTQKSTVIDLTAMQCRFGRTTSPIKCTFVNTFQHRDSEEANFHFTCDATTVLNRKGAVVVLSPAHIAFAAPHTETLTFLVSEGIVEYSAWSPPFKMGGPSPSLDSLRQDMFVSVLQTEVAQVMGLAGDVVCSMNGVAMQRQRQEQRGRAETGIGHRLTDGLEDNQSSKRVPFYGPEYSSDQGTLPFCSLLPDNPEGMRFTLLPIVQMGADALMKLHEMQRQGTQLAARHIIALYVYSYELSYDEPGYDQIYAEINKAMRLRIKSKIEYWRPLIWEFDMALEALPSFKGKAYRGINVQIDPAQYEAGGAICWPSFSSASQNQSVAEEFAKGEAGTLFFLTSVSAKPISAISRFPDEAEVLFPPNTMFQVTSTLFGASEIGSFYGRVDNVAMLETTGQVEPADLPIATRYRVAGHTAFLLQVPSEISTRILDILTDAGVMVVQSAEMEEEKDGVAGELVIVHEIEM